MSPITSTVGSVGASDLQEIKGSKKEKGGTSFEDTLNRLGETNDKVIGENADAKLGRGPNDVANKKASQVEKPILKFSNHALERMNTRGITFSPEQITKIEQGMQKASEKGAKETLVLTDDSALIVSLKNSTVVTVMDKDMLKENIFTNIDATVFV